MVENFFKEGKLLVIPKKCEKVQVFQRVANQFEFGKEYTEKEVNQRLREIYEDYALLRRYLVDYQYLERDKFGKFIRNVSNTQKLYKWLFKSSETK